MPLQLRTAALIALSCSIVASAISPSYSASQNPIELFLSRATPAFDASDDETLRNLVVDNALVVGAAVGELCDRAVESGDSGDPEAETAAFELAERIARLHLEENESGAPLDIVLSYRAWSDEQRERRRQARSLDQQASQQRGFSPQGSLELHGRAKEIYLEIGDLRSEAISWGSMGTDHWIMGDFDGVKEKYGKALELRRAIEDRILEGRALSTLGSAHAETGDYEQAAEWLQQAIALRTKTGDTGGLGTSLAYLGQTYSFMNRLVDARNMFERAIPILEETHRQVQLVETLRSLGTVYADMRRLERAEAAYERAVEISQALYDPFLEASCRTNLAIYYRTRSRYRQALEQLEIVSGLLQRRSDPTLQAMFYRERGETYLSMGELDRARDDLLAYVESSRTLESPRYSIEAMTKIGYLYEQLGAHEQAYESTQRAEEMARETGDRFGEVTAMSRRAGIENLMGRHEDALATWRRVFDMENEDGAEEGALFAELGIANTFAFLGQTDEAISWYDSAEPRVLESGRVDLIVILNLGRGHCLEDTDPERAAEYYDRALESLEIGRSSVGGAEIRTGYFSGERRHYYEEVARFYSNLELERGDGSWGDRAFRTIERAKARGLLDLVESSAMHETSPEEEALLDSLYDLQDDPDGNREEILRLEKEYMEVRALRLKRSMKPLERETAVARLQDVQKQLPRGTVLLEYALGDSTTLAWVVFSEGFDLVQLADRKTLTNEIERFRDSMARPGMGDATLRRTARNLYRMLLEPVEDRLSDADELVIVPDGILFEIPFEALLTRDIEEGSEWSTLPFVARDFAPVYAPSASVYVKLKSADSGGDFDLELLALGDPEFSTLRNGGAGAALAALPHTRSEVMTISAGIDQERKAIFLGAEATETNLKRAVSGNSSRILHLATHGLVDPVQPTLSSVAFCPDPEAGDDGYLHTLEILALPLDVSLVVLSACETARGKVSRGEGVVGLGRAFLASGTDGIVASLWAVSDVSTSELMKVFYERMLENDEPAARALNQARIALMTNPEYSHPFFWSPFVLVGTDRAPR